MTISLRPRLLNDHWLNAGAAWREDIDRSFSLARYVAQCRADAFAIWKQTKPAKGTLAQAYLESRGLHLLPPASLRFHPGLKHSAARTWPALTCLVTDGRSGSPLGVYAVYLTPDGASLVSVVR